MRNLRKGSPSSPSSDKADIPHEWISTGEALRELVQTLLEQPAYAIDTEFHRERTYYPHLALVQIAWPGGLVLIDPLAVDIAAFVPLFDSDVVAVFHAADQDLEVLQHMTGSAPRRIFDTQVAAGFVGFSTPSLSTLSERVLGIRLSKGDRLTDWTQRPLTNAQKNYAASDVLHLLELRDLLNEQLEASGRSQWLEEELALLQARSRGDGHAERAWWRLKDGRVLRGKDRLIAQQLCVWREKRAQTEDKPVRFVLPDLAVLTIAQSRPDSPDALGTMRGLDGRYLKGGAGREILEVVRAAIDMPSSALQVPVPDDFDRKLRPALTLVSAWVAQLARRREDRRHPPVNPFGSREPSSWRRRRSPGGWMAIGDSGRRGTQARFGRSGPGVRRRKFARARGKVRNLAVGRHCQAHRRLGSRFAVGQRRRPHSHYLVAP